MIQKRKQLAIPMKFYQNTLPNSNETTSPKAIIVLLFLPMSVLGPSLSINTSPLRFLLIVMVIDIVFQLVVSPNVLVTGIDVVTVVMNVPVGIGELGFGGGVGFAIGWL